MFVNEWGGHDGTNQSLWLLQAIPRSWLKVGDRLAVKEMGTHFGGRVDLDIAVKDTDSVVVSTKLDLVVAPAAIRMRLRSGDGRPLVKATVNGHETAVLAGDTIQLPTRTKGIPDCGDIPRVGARITNSRQERPAELSGFSTRSLFAEKRPSPGSCTPENNR